MRPRWAQGRDIFFDPYVAYNNICLVQAINYPTAGVVENAHPATQESHAGLFRTIRIPKETFVPAKSESCYPRSWCRVSFDTHGAGVVYPPSLLKFQNKQVLKAQDVSQKMARASLLSTELVSCIL